MGENPFGGRVRVRVCGILEADSRVLLVNIKSPTMPELFWMPPGGGVQFGETLSDALKREFREETGLEIEVGDFRFHREYVKPPWHAIELYYEVRQTGGELKKGTDPELDESNQMILDVAWMPRSRFGEIRLVPEDL